MPYKNPGFLTTIAHFKKSGRLSRPKNLGIDTKITSLGRVLHDLMPFLGIGGHLGFQNGGHFGHHFGFPGFLTTITHAK